MAVRNLYTHPIGPDSLNRFEIVNTSGNRWGTESYASAQDARAEIRRFWRGVSGVDLAKFSVRPIASIALPSDLDKRTAYLIARRNVEGRPSQSLTSQDTSQ